VADTGYPRASRLSFLCRIGTDRLFEGLCCRA
jgi:hypothetical protein